MDNHEEAGAFLRALSRGTTSCIRGGGDFDFTGRSARDRALGLDGASEADIRNFFALPDAERYLYRSLTVERLDEREHYLALHFLAVGHVLHVLQDMTSPAHVRNDFVGDHLNLEDIFLGQSLEDHGKTDAGLEQLAKAAASGLASRPYVFLSGQVSGEILARYSPASRSRWARTRSR